MSNWFTAPGQFVLIRGREVFAGFACREDAECALAAIDAPGVWLAYTRKADGLRGLLGRVRLEYITGDCAEV
jgi:hypothetical protein